MRQSPAKEGGFAGSGKDSSENRQFACVLPPVFEWIALSLDNEPYRSDAFPMALRRLGPDPHLGGAKTPALSGCPEIFELETGDFAVVGQDITANVLKQLPEGATCGSDERIVLIPRKTLVLARPDIPKEV